MVIKHKHKTYSFPFFLLSLSNPPYTLLLYPLSPNQVLIMLVPCLRPSMALHSQLNTGQAPLCSIFPGLSTCSGLRTIYNPVPHNSPTFVPDASQNRLFVFFLTYPTSFELLAVHVFLSTEMPFIPLFISVFEAKSYPNLKSWL